MSQTNVFIDFDAFMEETGIDKKTMQELYVIFESELMQERESLLTSLAEKDYGKICDSIHKIKGIAGSYKADSVFNFALLFNENLRNKIYTDIEQKVSELTELIEKTNSHLKHYFDLK